MVLPRAGKGASITLLMRGWTRAGEMPRRFSTSSKICKGQKSRAARWSSLPDEGGLPPRLRNHGEARGPHQAKPPVSFTLCVKTRIHPLCSHSFPCGPTISPTYRVKYSSCPLDFENCASVHLHSPVTLIMIYVLNGKNSAPQGGKNWLGVGENTQVL